jgi:hypothetical protein
MELNADPELCCVFPNEACCDVDPDESCCRSEWVRMAAMSSSVAEGTLLRRKERDEKGSTAARMVIKGTFLVLMVLAVLAVQRSDRVHAAERVRGPFGFAPDSA